MFKAVGKYFRAVWYLMTFRVDKASETLRMNPGVVSANYDRIIDEKRQRLNQYKDAVSAMIAQEESKKEKLRAVTEEISKLEKLRGGAAAKAKRLVEQYNGIQKRSSAIPNTSSARRLSKISRARWLKSSSGPPRSMTT